uniref:Predicted protein n=2 Tax=Hordeum vulgare subsp. vulgare TaxID=112509 RepID=F2E9Q1_HORVV|nr:predicted protein [Hordeum vulgare subsp. vulgare]
MLGQPRTSDPAEPRSGPNKSRCAAVSHIQGAVTGSVVPQPLRLHVPHSPHRQPARVAPAAIVASSRRSHRPRAPRVPRHLVAPTCRRAPRPTPLPAERPHASQAVQEG